MQLLARRGREEEAEGGSMTVRRVVSRLGRGLTRAWRAGVGGQGPYGRKRRVERVLQTEKAPSSRAEHLLTAADLSPN